MYRIVGNIGEVFNWVIGEIDIKITKIKTH